MTEAMLLGLVALRTGEKIEWDAKKMRVINLPEANKLAPRIPQGLGAQRTGCVWPSAWLDLLVAGIAPLCWIRSVVDPFFTIRRRPKYNPLA